MTIYVIFHYREVRSQVHYCHKVTRTRHLSSAVSGFSSHRAAQTDSREPSISAQHRSDHRFAPDYRTPSRPALQHAHTQFIASCTSPRPTDSRSTPHIRCHNRRTELLPSGSADTSVNRVRNRVSTNRLIGRQRATWRCQRAVCRAPTATAAYAPLPRASRALTAG